MSNDVILANEIERINNLDSRCIQLVLAKLLMPEVSWGDIGKEVCPELSTSSINRLVQTNKLSKIIQSFEDSPYLSGALVSTKLFPLSILILHKLMISESVRDNVKATAAKELIRVGEASARKLASLEPRANPKDNLNRLIDNSVSELAASDDEP